MKIITINGGLANQVFQYIFARYIESITGEKCILENSYFFNKPDHNGYEIEKIWGIKLELLSNYFSENVWKEMICNLQNGVSIPQQLYDNGINLTMINETNDIEFEGNAVCISANQFIPNIALSKGDLYYHGYWINKHWFENNKEVILKELTFPPIDDEKNRIYKSMICESKSVAVHLRRGDFVKLGWNVPEEFYYNSMKSYNDSCPDAMYFIFSDDIPWCKSNYEKLGFHFAEERIVFVEGNFNKVHNYIDLQLMTLCKGMIMSNSSFAYLAILLNKQRSMPVINPTFREI